jgi:DNA-binding LacI/PurR family transcriptional regulator
MSKLKQGRATAYDVADLAGVSQSAVSRAFTPGASVSREMRQKIMKAADELGYRPNAMARSLITQQTNIVGVAVGNLINPYFASALEELSRQLADADLRMLLFPATYETSITKIIQYQVEALIMLSVPPGPDLVEECKVCRIPIIMFNRSSDDESQACILGDNAAGGRMIAAYLLAGGHQRFAFISAGSQSTASNEREAGYRAYLLEQGIELHHREDAAFSVENAAGAIRKLMLLPQRPDAIFCANDHVAMIAMQVAQSEFGINVGTDISIIGFDDVPQASWPGLSLTTYSQPIAPMVAATLEVVEQLRQGIEPDHMNIVPGSLVARASARRPTQPVRSPSIRG